MKTRTLIKKIVNVNSEGVSFKLTEKASLTGGLSTDQWYVSWDKIGKALFGDQYSDAESVKGLKIERGEATFNLPDNMDEILEEEKQIMDREI